MSYNLFNNVISNAVSNNNNILTMIRNEILPLQQQMNFAFNNICYIEVKLENIEGKYIQSNFKKTIINNRFVDSDFNMYILNDKVILYKNGWFYIEFNTNIELILNLNIDLDVYIENEIFITNETKFFGSSSYPKNINITYI